MFGLFGEKMLLYSSGNINSHFASFFVSTQKTLPNILTENVLSLFFFIETLASSLTVVELIFIISTFTVFHNYVNIIPGHP